MKKKVLIYSSGTLLLALLYCIIVVFLFSQIFLVEVHTVTEGAHRGDSVNYIENTLPAIESAVKKERYQFIEFDIQYTKDKIIVVHHDKSLTRIQGKSERIPELNYTELENISDYYIPTYEEVMNMSAGKKPLNIEIKSQGNFTDDKIMADFIINDCKERGILNTTIISSISRELIKYINIEYNQQNISNKEYYKTKPLVETGIIYYMDYSTFEIQGDRLIISLVSTFNKTGAHYLMLHGNNLPHYKKIKKIMPENTKIVFWYFDDRIYITSDETKLRFSLKELFQQH